MFWRGVLGYLPVNIVQGVVGLLTIVVFTRVLSPNDYGTYALAFSVMINGHRPGSNAEPRDDILHGNHRFMVRNNSVAA